MQNKIQQQSGFTLVEVLVLLLIFSGMFMVMLAAFENSARSLTGTKAKLVAVEIANAQMEVLRNINYNDLGTITGSPSGSIPPTKEIIRSNSTFTVYTTVRYYDDPFDGCAGERAGFPPDQWSECIDGTVVNKPRDIPAYQNNPADYKKSDVKVTWLVGGAEKFLKLSTIIAPQDLEGDTDKGFLLVEVINADGVPVANASVTVTNTDVVPNVNIAMSTDNNGHLLLLDLEPSQNSYVIKVTKDGYTTDRTCSQQSDGTACTDSEGVPDPFLENISVHIGELEEATFIIDEFSTLAINSYNEQCVALDGIDFTLMGLDKKISVNPEILKNSIDLTTDAGQTPHWSKADVEWDLYDLLVNTAGYNIAGINHDLALNVLPNTNTTINVLLASQTSNSLLVTVKDSGTDTNLSNASVRLVNGDQSYDETKFTGQGFIEQTDWSGGDGQADFIDTTKYFSDNTHVDTTSTTGQITLLKNEPNYSFSEDFSTGTQKDGGNTTANWSVPDQELKMTTFVGKYSTTEREYAQTFQLNSQYGKVVSALLTATEQVNGQTLEYYLSADGGTNFEQVFLPMAVPHEFSNVGDDLRVRIEMETTDEDVTPIVEDFNVSYDIENYDSPGELTSSTFNLGGSAPSNSEFTTINWQPTSQPAEAGSGSIKFQLATNNDNSTWNYIGPDGTDSSYYTESNTDITASHDGDQYLRYKVYLSTEDTYYTPTLTNIRIGYTLECLPPGQAYFANLTAETYIVESSLDGYQPSNETLDVSGYTTKEILLTINP
ncbi:carboxypeptidase-like regulatory domain-containing protein [Patescibacteria group bacterium]|nr:carboxypeptidase-like regulatory domain-containing protein [Patescibacteria group bacterium]